MTKNKGNCLFPQYMKGFKCIGSACEDSCCVGWKVDIDHESYRKYQKIRDEELSPLFDRYISRNRASGHSEGSYAKVKLLENVRCPFLNEEMLCRIQVKRGEDYLSDVCFTYPRVVNLINGVIERSAAMSCPEAARLALLNPYEMEFDEDEDLTAARNIIRANFNTNALNLNNKPYKYLWELRIFTITLLQNRSYPLYQRLIFLGMFFLKLQQCILSENINEIPGLIASYTSIIEDGSLQDSLSAIPVQHNIQMELLKSIADMRYLMGISSKRYHECFSEFLIAVGYSKDAKVEEIGQRYQEACKEYYEPFMGEYGYILENYLVNHVFKNLFPFTGEKSLFDSYMMLVLHFALIKMHLIGMAGFHKGLTVELVIKLIQSFAKTIEHNQQYLNQIANLMRKNGFNNMAYMAILLKN